MWRKYIFHLALVIMLTGLFLVGCGQPDVNEGNGFVENGQGNENVDQNGKDNNEPQPVPVRDSVDLTDPEAVAMAFVDLIVATEFDQAAELIVGPGASSYRAFRGVYEENIYGLKIWELLLSSAEIEVASQGTSGDLTLVRMEVAMPDFGMMEYLVDDPGEQELIRELFVQLALSGFKGGIAGEFIPASGGEFDEDVWDEAFELFKGVVDRLPLIHNDFFCELILEDGEWKLDEFPLFFNILD